jgi:hypothetical protein
MNDANVATRATRTSSVDRSNGAREAQSARRRARDRVRDETRRDARDDDREDACMNRVPIDPIARARARPVTSRADSETHPGDP